MGFQVADYHEEYGLPQELRSINNKQAKRVQFHRTRAENFTVSYFLLQVLFLLIISVRSSSSSSLKSNEQLVFFFAILISSVIFFLAFLEAVITFYKTQYELDKNRADLEVMLIEKNNQTRSKHENISRKPDVVQLYKRKFYISFITLALFAFAVLELYACRLFLRGV